MANYRTDRYHQRLEALRSEYSSFRAHHMELSEFVAPVRGRFLVTDRNKGKKRHHEIINDTATRAHRTLIAGLMAGITSPARPWFRLETPDKDMMEYGPVKHWLAAVEALMRDIFNQSNFYNMLPPMYGEEGLFGTGCMLQVDDFEDVTRFFTQSVGGYYLAASDRGTIDTFYREYENTVSQIVRKFGLDRVSDSIRRAYDTGKYDSWYPIAHAIEPNIGRNTQSAFAKNKPFRSVYFEQGRDGDTFLRESGFDRFPVRAPRWETTLDDVYGTNSPGIMSLGSVKQLQFEEREKGKAIAKKVTPPLKGPGSLKNVRLRQLPGSAVLYTNNDPNNKDGLSPIHDPNISLGDLREDIAAVEDRISKAYFVDVFFAISQMEGVQPRNIMELSERKEEALLQLGPMLQQQHNELLDPTIDDTFARIVETDIMPPPPEELQGSPLKVEYISILAQAQRAIGVGTIERMSSFVTGLMDAGLSDGRKFDGDQAIDEYAAMTGVVPKVIRTDEDVAALRAEEQKMQQAMAVAEMAKPASDAADAASKLGDLAQ